jgi:hypothetical protein
MIAFSQIDLSRLCRTMGAALQGGLRRYGVWVVSILSESPANAGLVILVDQEDS